MPRGDKLAQQTSSLKPRTTAPHSRALQPPWL